MGGFRFSEILIFFFEKCENAVKLFILLGCAALFCCQAVQTFGPVRKYLCYVEQIEGRDIEGERVKVAAESCEIAEKSATALPEASAAKRQLVITAVGRWPQERACVIVNGRDVVPFVEGQAVVVVGEGDKVEIDASHTEQLMIFRVSARNSDIVNPEPGATVEAEGNKILLGPVRFKH